MASSIGKKISSGIILALLGLAVIAMVVTGFGTDGMGGLGGVAGGGGTTVATVAGETITEQDLSDAISRQFRQAQQQNPELTMQEFLQGETAAQILNQLIVGAALMDFGTEQGLAVSDEMIDRQIVQIPAFQNFTGRFDDATFREALATANITEAQLRQDIARALMQQQLLGPIALGGRVPDRLARTYADLLLERRQGMIGVVPAEQLAQGIEVSEAEIARYYRDNLQRFVVPERRVIRYALLDPQAVAGSVTVTDQEIQAQYRDNQAQYAPQQRRSLQQVVLPDRAAAQAFAQRVRGGTSFTDAAATAGFAPADIDLGEQTPEGFAEVANQEIARAAFAANEGAIVGPLQSELGFHVVRVEDVATTPGRSLEQARNEIELAIRERKVAEALNQRIDRIQEMAEEGATVQEIAQATGLQLRQTPPVTATGQVPGQEGQMPPEALEIAPVLQSAFELDAEQGEIVVEQLGEEERFALLNVERTIPAAAPPIAEIQDQVRAAVLRDKALQRAREVARRIQQNVQGGMELRQAFAQAGMPLPSPQPVNLRRMDISQGGQQVPPPLALLFSLPEGGARILEAPGQAGWFVVHHSERTPGDASQNQQLLQTVRTELSDGSGDEIAQQFARAIELRTEIERDAEAAPRLRRRLTGTGTE